MEDAWQRHQLARTRDATVGWTFTKGIAAEIGIEMTEMTPTNPAPRQNFNQRTDEIALELDVLEPSPGLPTIVRNRQGNKTLIVE